MRKAVMMVLCVLTLFCIFIPAVYAVTGNVTKEVTNIEEKGTYAFFIQWEKNDLTAVLISPSGQRIYQDQPTPGVTVLYREGIIIFRVDEAETGLWQVEFNANNNGKVRIVTQRLIKPLYVKDVDASQTDKNINVTFLIDGEKGRECSYEVFITAGEDMDTGRFLGKGNAKAGETVKCAFSAPNVGSYDEYTVIVKAECQYDGFSDFHSGSSASFAYENPNAPGIVKNVSYTLKEAGVEITWESPDGKVTGYFVSAKTDELYHSVNIDESAAKYALVPLNGEERITVSISAVRNGITGRAVDYEIDTSLNLQQLLNCTLPEDGVMMGSVELTYATDGEVEIESSINEKITNTKINGTGILRLTLMDGDNRVTLKAKREGGIWIAEDRNWVSDTTAPMIRIYGDPDGITTSAENIELSGQVQGADVVNIGGEQIALDPFGNFRRSIPLAFGANEIKVLSSDRAGNEAEYLAHVFRDRAGGAFPWAFVISFFVAAVIVAGYALKGRRRAK